jgi:purine-nucleoside/S-methyl-5'-thioadenosine phosphorylase / adenosine deaminase
MIVTSHVLGSFHDLTHGMSTRTGGVSPGPYGMNLSFKVGDVEANVRRNRELFFERMGVQPDRAVFAGQIHSANIVRVDSPGTYPDCDGLVTNLEKVFCCISVADCIPIFLFDPKEHVVAAVHAGWRGTAAGIASRAISVMGQEFHSKPHNIFAFVGPGAGPCCYEVGMEVASKFPREFTRTTGGKLTVDLKRVNSRQLMEAGLEEEHVETSTKCTICTSHLHSFRRDGPGSGRMMGIIGMG